MYFYSKGFPNSKIKATLNTYGGLKYQILIPVFS